MQTTRRGFLSTLGILPAGVALPPSLMARHLNPAQLDELHHHTQSLARHVHGTPPIVILQSARSHLVDVEALLAAATGRHRLTLHRTAGLTALVAAYALRWAAKPQTATLLE
jgi:hypothetical protein